PGGDILLSGIGTSGLGAPLTPFGSVVINDIPAFPGRFYQHGTPSIGPSGDIFCSYIEFDFPPQPSVFPPALQTFVFMDYDFDASFSFGIDNLVAATDNGFNFLIAPQPNRGKGIIPVHKVIQTGPHAGRNVIVWSDLTGSILPPDFLDMNVISQYTDDQNTTWSPGQPVHGLDPAYQFMPWIGTDPVTGNVYVGYYDSAGDTTNNRAVEWKVVGSDDGVNWTPPLLVAQAPSDAQAAPGGPQDMLEYNGIDVVNHCIYTCWADNANFTMDNPDGTLTSNGYDVLTSVLGLDAD
ncbi:MAG: hypothetical protein ACYTG6_02465, partial [Planctomycetota bacterium]